MALRINGTEWLQCEWRLFLSPSCPYVEDVRSMYNGLFYAHIVYTVVLAILLSIRYFYQKISFLRANSSINSFEVVLVSTLFLTFARLVQIVSILFFTEEIPLFLLNFFFSWGHSMAEMCVSYYWISLVRALPRSKMLNSADVHRYSKLNTMVGVLTGIGFLSSPFLEGGSAQVTLTNPHLADALLSTSYAILSFGLFSSFGGVLLFGSKLQKLIKESIDFGKTNRDDLAVKRLQAIHDTIWIALLILPGLLLYSGISVFLMLIARYYIWSARVWSLLFLFSFSSAATSTGFLASSFVIIRDLISGSQTGVMHPTTDGNETHPTTEQRTALDHENTQKIIVELNQAS